MYHWEFTNGFVQEKPNFDEYFWILSSLDVRNDTESAWMFVEVSRSGKLDFPNVIFSINFPNIYDDYLLASVIDSFLLLFW